MFLTFPYIKLCSDHLRSVVNKLAAGYFDATGKFLRRPGNIAQCSQPAKAPTRVNSLFNTMLAKQIPVSLH